MAAALVDMVCQLTVASEGGDGGPSSSCAAVEELRAKLLRAVDADTESYRQVIAASRLPVDTRERAAARDAALAAARLHAAEVPLQAAATCLEVLDLVRDLRDGYYAPAASELAVAVHAAMTCVHGGAVDVEVNLKHLDDGPAVMQMRRRSEEIVSSAGDAFAELWPALRDAAADPRG